MQWRLVKWILALLTLSSPLWIYMLFNSSGDYDPFTSYIFVPVILLLNVAAVMFFTQGELFLRRTMLVGLLAKLACTGVYLFVVFRVYDAAADAAHYFFEGNLYATDVLWNGQWKLLHPFWSSNAIYMLAGALIVFLGPALSAISFLFATFAFWGEYLFFRAFCAIAPAEADRRTAALALFLFPSILYWTACVGKDSVIALFIGLAVYGFSMLTKSASPGGVLCTGFGLAGTMVLRPHVAAMLSIAMLLPFAMSKNRKGLTGFISKALVGPLLICGSLYLTLKAQTFLQMENYQQAATVLTKVGQDNSFGGSTFNVHATLAARTFAAPLLFFRPFPWEARSLQALIASGEGLLILSLAWQRRRQFVAVVRGWRQRPFSAFLLLFVIEFSLVYSAAITNFGLLARQRLMALPMLLMLFYLVPDDNARKFFAKDGRRAGWKLPLARRVPAAAAGK